MNFYLVYQGKKWTLYSFFILLWSAIMVANIIFTILFASKLKKVINLPKSDERSLPFLGRIAAGNPIEAITGSFEQISVPNYLINGKDEHFTLEVTGDSMIEDGINDGDIVVIKKSNIANSGDIIVALVDDNEVTLKRFRSYKNSIALEPANKNYKTRIFGEDRVKVQGKLVGLIRKF